MNARAVILSGAAVLALSLGGSCLAQESGYDQYSRYGNGPPESTPSEMQQTQELNQQSSQGNAPYSSRTGYGGPPGGDENAPMGDEAPYGPQDQYQDQQQQYQGQMQQYRDQQQRYRYDRQRYAQDIRDYDVAQYAWSYPAPFVYRYGEGFGLQPLYLTAEPSQQLWQVPVEGPGGRWVGRVRNVETGPDGRPRRVEIALNRRVSVWVQPGDMRFDPSEGILYTDLTRDQLWTMPGATVESAPL
jgi:type II secretory pathway pseudopilin PulG